jgi:hypothetical protein
LVTRKGCPYDLIVLQLKTKSVLKTSCFKLVVVEHEEISFLKFLKCSNFQNLNITRYEIYVILLDGYKKLNPIQSLA